MSPLKGRDLDGERFCPGALTSCPCSSCQVEVHVQQVIPIIHARKQSLVWSRVHTR